MTVETLIEFTKTYAIHKKGTKLSVGAKELDAIPQDVYKVIQPAMDRESHDEGGKEKSQEPFNMDAVEGYEGLFIEVDETYTLVLLSASGTKYTYETDDHNEYVRYEVTVEYEGDTTTVRLPGSVIQNMWKQIEKHNATPVEKHRPTFLVSKTGTGKKTRWSVNWVGSS